MKIEPLHPSHFDYEPPEEPWPSGSDARARKAPTIARGKRGGDFLAEYEPISYTIEGMLPSGSIYGLTARRGTGKTAFLITASLAIMKGTSEVMGSDVERGRVAYVTKENPDDFRMKLAANCYVHGIDHNFLNEWMLVLDGRADSPESICQTLKINAEEYGAFQLVCYDTFQAGFAADATGKEFNDNAGVLRFIMRLRPITEIIGKPSGLVAFHPTKNATEDELVPYGGGSIMNEIDGNLTLWANAPYQIKLGWNRVRGPQFEPRHFKLEQFSCPDIVDKKSRQILLPVLRPSTAQDVEEKAQTAAIAGLALIRAMAANPGGTVREWMLATGMKSPGAIHYALTKLKKDKLAETVMDKWSLTTKGKAFASERGDE
jgi:hypothetical protein